MVRWICDHCKKEVVGQKCCHPSGQAAVPLDWIGVCPQIVIRDGKPEYHYVGAPIGGVDGDWQHFCSQDCHAKGNPASYSRHTAGSSRDTRGEQGPM
jgi:hypothetical protein